MTSQRGGGRVRTLNLRELGDVADTPPADGDVYTWSEAAQLFVPGAGSGTSPGVFLAHVGLSGHPVAGGMGVDAVLYPATTGGYPNSTSGCCVPWVYAPGHGFQMQVVAPPFTTGTLAVSYAEMDISNLDGTERIAVGIDNPSSLASEQVLVPVPFDDAGEATGAGTDLALVDGVVTTTAGGVFVVAYFVQFAVSADFG